MQEKRSQDEQQQDRSEEHIDNIVLDFMLLDAWPWSVEEIVRELGNQPDAEDAIGRLTRAALVHRSGSFVFPTRAARRANELQIGTV